jgi:PAS domain S-box-containing protein
VFDHPDFGKVYLSVHTNITKRKKVETALQESEELFRIVMSNAPISIFATDKNGIFILHEGKALKKTGMKPGENVGVSAYDLFSDLKVVEHNVNVINGKSVLDRVLNGENISGITELNDVIFDNQFVPIFDINNDVNGLIGVSTDITANKKAEEGLLLEKENFRHSLDDSPLGVRIITLEGNTIYTNKTLLYFYGYDNLEELQKTPLKNRYTPESYLRSLERKRQREHGDFSDNEYEISIIRKNGEIRHLQVFRKEILWAGTRQFQVIYNDITRRKMAEKALQESEELFHIVISNAPISIFATDEKGIFILHEGKALEKTGMKSGENVGVSAYNLFYDLKVVEHNGNVIRGKTVLDRVLNGEDISGITELNDVIFDNQFVSIRDINGQVTGLIGVATDITGSRKTEAALRGSEAIFRSIFENSLIGISISSTEGKLLQANVAYARMYGYENPEIMLKEVQDVGVLFAQPKQRKEVLRILRRNGFMEAKEFELIKKDGSRFFVLVSACEIRDINGRHLFNQTTHLDLSNRRKMEDELRNSRKLLEKLNQHLNEIRENERALISREIHDELGQSLTALKLDLNRMHKYVNSNSEAVIQLNCMIELVSNTIKDVQRISSDLRPGILDDLGLVSAIEWYCDEFEKRTAIKCSQKLENSDYNDPQINLTLFRVLQETLTNVIRHANASSVIINLHKTPKGTALAIKDNGTGIAPEKIQSAKSLGLIGMRERVKQFGGRVDISSEKGEGTQLIIFIPDKKGIVQ